MQPIRIRLALALVLPTIIFCIGLLMFISQDTAFIMANLNDEKMNTQLRYYADYVNESISETELSVQSLVDYTSHDFLPLYLSSQDPIKNDEAYQALVNYTRQLSSTTHGGAVFIYFLSNAKALPPSIVYTYSSTLQQSVSLPALSHGYFVTETLNDDKQWFFDSIKSHTGRWYGPQVLHKLSTSEQSVIYSQCAYVDGEPYAIIGYERPIESLKRDLSQMKYYQTGYAALVNERQQVISHPSLKAGQTASEVLGDAYAYIDQTIAHATEGKLSYKWTDHRDKTLSFVSLNNHWTLVLTAYMDEVMKPSIDLSHKMILLYIIATALVALSGYFLGVLISKPIVKLGLELNDFTAHENIAVLSYHTPLKKDQYGKLAYLFYERCNHYLEKKKALKNHTENLSHLVEERTHELNETHRALMEKRQLIEQSQQQIKKQNHVLESSINTVLHTQNKLIEEEKIASFSEIIRGVVVEIRTPIIQCSSLLEREDDLLLATSRDMLRSVYSRSQLLKTYSDIQKNNRQLIGNLMFSKDIVDYVKDLTTSKSLKAPSVIELHEYLEKAALQVEQLALNYAVDIQINSPTPVYLHTDVMKFLHLISSLLIHIATLPRDTSHNIRIHISSSIVENDLHLRFVDEEAESFIQERLLSKSNEQPIHMGIQMIELIMRESFSGVLTVPSKIKPNGNLYELQFPQICHSVN